MPRPKPAIRFLAVAWLLTLLAAPARAQDPLPAGVIKSVAGRATIVRATGELPASPGGRVFQGDTLRTAANGRLGLTLKDGTRLSLGGGTELRLDTFDYAPAEGRLGLVLRLVRGVTAYISGHIAQLAPGAVKIETPTSVIGIRGTHLLIGADEP